MVVVCRSRRPVGEVRIVVHRELRSAIGRRTETVAVRPPLDSREVQPPRSTDSCRLSLRGNVLAAVLVLLPAAGPHHRGMTAAVGPAFPTVPTPSGDALPVDSGTARGSTVPALLAAAALAMVVTHWLRILPLGYQAPGQTRWEDFADLLTPYVVAGPMLVALGQAGAERRTWTAALAGAALFVQGHGVHLSANSISYARGDAAPAYLWDEIVGHALWFVGLTVLLLAVAHAVRPLSLPSGPAAVALALLVGGTWAVNVVEAGHVPLGSALAVGLVVQGWRTRDHTTGRLLATAFTASLVLVGAYGVWQRGFPQFSELGWL